MRAVVLLIKALLIKAGLQELLIKAGLQYHGTAERSRARTIARTWAGHRLVAPYLTSVPDMP
eukprot:869024-Rhodomonas_salina.1